jgi:hypothetical protein
MCACLGLGYCPVFVLTLISFAIQQQTEFFFFKKKKKEKRKEKKKKHVNHETKKAIFKHWGRQSFSFKRGIIKSTIRFSEFILN